MPTGEIDVTRVKLGAAVAAAALLLSVQGAAFHQILSVRDGIHEVRTEQKGIAVRQEGIMSTLAKVEASLSRSVTREEVRQEVDLRVSVYGKEHAMLVLRLEAMEARLKRMTHGGD